MREIIQLVGRYAGERINVPDHVAKAKIAAGTGAWPIESFEDIEALPTTYEIERPEPLALKTPEPAPAVESPRRRRGRPRKTPVPA